MCDMDVEAFDFSFYCLVVFELWMASDDELT